MNALHRAAARRAYRTLAQGLGSSAMVTVLVAIATDGKSAMAAAGITLATVAATALSSFWQGVARGLPEAESA